MISITSICNTRDGIHYLVGQRLLSDTWQAQKKKNYEAAKAFTVPFENKFALSFELSPFAFVIDLWRLAKWAFERFERSICHICFFWCLSSHWSNV